MNYKVEFYQNPPVGELYLSNEAFLFCYCQRGRLSSEKEEAKASLTHGDVFILPKGHKRTFSVSVAQTYFYVISFDEIGHSESEELFEFLEGLKEDSEISFKMTLPPEEIVFFESVLSKISREESHPSQTSRLCVLSLLSSVFDIVEERKGMSMTERYGKESFIKYCVLYVDAHCKEDLSLEGIIRMCATSRTQFCKLFKKETGLTFNDYLNRKRIQRALALIKSGEKITDVAYMCGYSEFSTFYRNFKKFTGSQPNQYQKATNANKT